MTPRGTRAFAALAATLLAAGLVLAQPTQPALTRPATTTFEGQPLKGRITGVRGLVEVKLTDKGPWQPAKEDMAVDEGAEFRTGPRSAVQFVIEPDQTITLDRLGTMKLLTAVRNATGKTKTDVGMKYGRTRYDIAAGGLEHESTIRSPNSTLAVRGTKVSLTDTRPFPPEAVSLTGVAQFQAFKRQAVAFGGANKAKIDSTAGTAADTAFGQTVVDPSIALARTPAEAALVADLISRGSVVTVDRDTGIRIVRGGSVPTDKEIVSLLPNNLNFVLRWTGNANLDLYVVNKSETVYPSAGLNISASGGKTAFDHQGGPKGGVEIISWPANFPREFYVPAVNHVSGPTVPANMQVYLNAKQFPILSFDANGLPTQSTSIDFQSSPITPGKNIEAFTPGLVDLSNIPPAAKHAPAAAARNVGPLAPTAGRK